MKLSINARKLYQEAIFYINWAKKSKNRKVKRRLVIKSQVLLIFIIIF